MSNEPTLPDDGEIAFATEEAIAITRKFANGWFEDGVTTSLCPQMAVIGLADDGDGKPSVMIFSLMDGFNTVVEKRNMMRTAAYQVADRRFRLLAVALVTECWVAAVESDQPRTFILPEDSPDRYEIVMAQAMGINAHTICEQSPVTRDARGIVTLGEWSRPDARYQSVILSNFYRFFLERVLGSEEFESRMAKVRG